MHMRQLTILKRSKARRRTTLVHKMDISISMRTETCWHVDEPERLLEGIEKCAQNRAKGKSCSHKLRLHLYETTTMRMNAIPLPDIIFAAIAQVLHLFQIRRAIHYGDKGKGG